jgi:hypothetical protein
MTRHKPRESHYDIATEFRCERRDTLPREVKPGGPVSGLEETFTDPPFLPMGRYAQSKGTLTMSKSPLRPSVEVDHIAREKMRAGIAKAIANSFPRDGENILVDLDVASASLIEALGAILATMPRMRTTEGRQAEYAALHHSMPSDEMRMARAQLGEGGRA